MELIIFSNGQSVAASGTSCAAPLWAGFCALVNEQAQTSGLLPVGFLNPIFCTIGNGSQYGTAFHDITYGSNQLSSKDTVFYTATNGYDLATGWGTPTGSTLINALANVPTYPDVTLYNFSGGNDGAFPCAGPILSGNTLYGTAYEAGNGGYGAGTVYSIGTSGENFSEIYTFTNGGDGAWPVGGLILSGSTLYGTTSGGNSSPGSVFSVKTNGTGFTTLHYFGGGNDGYMPTAGLVLSGSTLYGTTFYGGYGAGEGNGTVFSVSTSGTGYKQLCVFTNANAGSNPQASLILSGSTLYGTTYYGGSSGNGTVFSLITNGTGYKTLYSFTGGSDGANPYAGLVLSGGTLYGVASAGGSTSSGTVFAIGTGGAGFRTVYSFNGTWDGAYPEGKLVLSGSTLYGTTLGGGPNACGMVFAVTTNGSYFTPVYGLGLPGSAGCLPYGGLAFAGTSVYGTAYAGGSFNNGVVFCVPFMYVSDWWQAENNALDSVGRIREMSVN